MLCAFICEMLMQIFAFKNNPTHTFENQRSSFKKKKNLIPLSNFKHEYAKLILSFLSLGNLQSCALPFLTEKLNPCSASRATPPTPSSFLSQISPQAQSIGWFHCWVEKGGGEDKKHAITVKGKKKRWIVMGKKCGNMNKEGK